jgi:asparagine synthase (glutamine-hydrolysing)
VHRDSLEETAEKVRYLVTDAIRRQTVSDVPVGTFLSGGLDSSLITSVCALDAELKGKSLPTFSVDYVDNEKYFTPNKFQPNSDGYYIRKMQQVFGTDHHWCILSPEDLLAELENATMARDLPGMADVDFSLLAFCRQIRENVTVALSGECADEIFGGYPWYRDPQIRDQDGFPWAQNTALRCQLLSPELSARLDGEDYVRQRYLDTCRGSDILPGTDPTERRMKEMVNLNLNWFMQTLLDRKDRMSMYSALEVRVPFCDYRIAEYLYGIPWEMKDLGGREKGLLRYAMRDYLPEEVLYRKKSPYPKTFHPRYLEAVTQRMKTLLEEKDAPIFALVQKEELQKMLESESVWPWYGQLMRQSQTLAYFLQLDFWLRHNQVEILW